MTFKYGLGDEFIDILKAIHKLGLDSTTPVDVRGREVSPRDVVAACLPDPAELGDLMHGVTCAGTWVTGNRQGRQAPRGLPVQRRRQRRGRMSEYGSQAVVWQTAINPVRSARARRLRRLDRHGRPRPRSVSRRTFPRPPHRARGALGDGGDGTPLKTRFRPRRPPC